VNFTRIAKPSMMDEIAYSNDLSSFVAFRYRKNESNTKVIEGRSPSKVRE